MNKYLADFETLAPNGELTIRVLPQIKNEWYYYHEFPSPVAHECKFDQVKVRQLTRALMLPERKTVRWRGKKMLVKKTSQKIVNFNFDLPLLQRMLAL